MDCLDEHVVEGDGETEHDEVGCCLDVCVTY